MIMQIKQTLIRLTFSFIPIEFIIHNYNQQKCFIPADIDLIFNQKKIKIYLQTVDTIQYRNRIFGGIRGRRYSMEAKI